MDDFSPDELAAIEEKTQEVGRYLFDRLQRPGMLNRRWWDDRLMAWAMADESVKIQMFRFIDVLPMLDTSESVVRHLHEYFDNVATHLPAPIRLGMSVAQPRSLIGRAVAISARRNAQGQARRFIAGSTSQEVLAAAMRERKQKRAFTLDILGEAVTSEVEADRYLQAYLDLLAGVGPTANRWPEVPQIDREPTYAAGVNHHGRNVDSNNAVISAINTVPRVNISVKLSALDSQFDPIDPVGTLRRVGGRLRTLLRAARAQQAFVNIDMESYRTKDLTLEIFRTILREAEFRDWPHVGIVIQCYLRDAEQDLITLRDWAAERGTPVWVRLVKGAYWDYETVFAQQTGWPIPVFSRKWESDANFERQTRFVMLNRQHLRPALGSHNIRSLAHGIAVAEHLGMPPGSFELQMLYGMADAEKQAIVDLGHRLRIYMPYGELIPGMAYLVRRLLENTSNDSFLRASLTDHVPAEVLLMNPLKHADASPNEKHSPVVNQTIVTAASDDGLPPFVNEPPTDFGRAENREAMTRALAAVRKQLGQDYPLWIDGQPQTTGDWSESRNPANTRELLGRTSNGMIELASAAVEAAARARPAWTALGARGRGEYLLRAAAVMRERRFELAAWEVLECGKAWREADGDIAEAVDFCEFYARAAIALEAQHGVDVPGEENRFEYLPRGVVGVIAPWNFPLAILTGMTVAALATGNTVVMKPSEQSALVGHKLMEIFRAVGLPAGALNLVTGQGEVVGAAIVDHPAVSVIAFTGSRAVGLHINRRAAEVSTNLTSVKRVIAEMGGKNAIIIDDDADLDEAVLAVVKSAFGYQGQKCSACSRCIVLDGVYDIFLERLVAAAKSLHIGPAEDPATSVGPVIDADSRKKILEYIELGKRDARTALAVDAGALAKEGHFVGPHIFADVAPTSRLAQEEIFGPVLAVMRARDLDEAFAILNGTDYALTGGIFSRSPAALDRARRELLVGNLYLNRGITGALVGRQPFGGFKMSGIGSKAGGAEYLLQFVLPRTVTENTMRRGFAPPASSNESLHAIRGANTMQ